MDIVDFRVRLRTIEGLEAWVPPMPQFERYVHLYKMQERLTYQSPEKTIEEMKGVGITHAVLCSGSDKNNKYIAKIANSYEEFIPVAGAKLDYGVMHAYSVLKNALKSGVFYGFNFGGLLQNPPMAIDDEKLYPLYALCVDYDVCAIIHSSLHYYTRAKLSLNTPFRLDNVAVDFPDLRLVMSHAGNGFDRMPLVLAQRHPNVYLEVSGLRPKHLSQSFIKAMNKWLKHKFIFGTDYPLLPFSIVEEWKQYIEKETHEKFFYQNAIEVLKSYGP